MKLRVSTLDRIISAYAEAVASGDLEAAEGWIAMACYAAERASDRRLPRIVDPATQPRRRGLRAII